MKFEDQSVCSVIESFGEGVSSRIFEGLCVGCGTFLRLTLSEVMFAAFVETLKDRESSKI
jgi:hypothetical protein